MAQAIGGRRCIIEYGVYYAAIILVFLPFVLVRRLVPDSWKRRSVLAPRSIWAETRGLTNMVVPFIFMA